MFYNALARKGKLDADTREEDMESVVAIHNCMNEGTWERILQWERVLCPPDDSDNDSARGRGSGPCLTKFMGRPTELSPKVSARSDFGPLSDFCSVDGLTHSSLLSKRPFSSTMY